MSAYCVVDIVIVKDPAKMQEYRSKVGPVMAKFGGKVLVGGGKFDVVEGNWRPTHPVIIEFPSLEQAHRWYDSEEYRELKALRLAAADGSFVFMDGVE